jgi:co-chaperonin GroES (HSP10)
MLHCRFHILFFTFCRPCAKTWWLHVIRFWDPNKRQIRKSRTFSQLVFFKWSVFVFCLWKHQASFLVVNRLPRRLLNPSRLLFLCLIGFWCSVSSQKPYVLFQHDVEGLIKRVLQKTATGIFLPTSATNNPLPEATVIATGPGAPNKDGQVIPTQVKAGDRVLLPGWGGSSIKVGDEVILAPVFRTSHWRYFSTGVLSVQRRGDSCKDTGMSTLCGAVRGAMACGQTDVSHQKFAILNRLLG